MRIAPLITPRARTTGLTAKEEELLRAVRIDDSQPGPVLRDFETLLSFLGDDGCPIVQRNQTIVTPSLVALNELLTYRTPDDLKRPQQRSFPYIQGLYLVLRASGIGRIEGTGSRGRLVVDARLVDSWRGLNLTERYLNLLEAWLVHAHSALLGRPTLVRRPFFLESNALFESIPTTGAVFGRPVYPDHILPLVSDDCHFALLELFGLFALQRAEPGDRGSWLLTGIRRPPFASALFAALAAAPVFRQAPDGRWPVPGVFGCLQPLLLPYFPDWRNNLPSPTSA